MADRSKAPVDTIAESSEDAVPAEGGTAAEARGSAEPGAESTAALSAAEIADELRADDSSKDAAALADEPAASATEDPAPAPSPASSSAPSPTPATAALAPLLPAPVRHSGDRIANRYRLEECLTQAGVFTSWRAVDEKLRRAVGIHLLAAGHQRSQAAVAAARQAALLGDPRFVQVLDAVEEGELVYIIREWLPDATDLGTLLAEGPLEAYEAYQMVRQVTAAIAAAHRKGMSHLRLTPACVLRSDSGQYRINGIAMDAALHGLSATNRAEAELTDTQALGALLFASLTHRWPYPEDRHGLQGMPRTVGVVPPEQVKAGVHRGLSDLCAQTLCRPPGRHLEPLTSPEALAKAIDVMPKIKQPEPEPLVLPEYPTRTYQGADRATAAGPARRPDAPAAPPLPPTLPGRTGKALKWGISFVLLAAVGLGSWGTAEALMAKRAPTSSSSPVTAGVGGNTKPKTKTQKSLSPLHLVGATEFSPRDAPIAGDQAPLTIDNNPNTSWITSQYQNYPNFGNFPGRADGSGIVVDLGSVQSVSGVEMTLPFSGQTMEVLAAPESATTAPGDSAGFTQRIANSTVAGKTLTSATLATPVRTRFVLVHVTSLPPDAGQSNTYRGGISEIQILG
ncbi:protein kinase family protein [Streptacidiphilus sp. MAP12-16]|uniref:protein kinase family protein n=1 Tax=Streptacidiphilus sp. MAP12-16 TaxID=3156300 RepID=UPI003514C1BF